MRGADGRDKEFEKREIVLCDERSNCGEGEQMGVGVEEEGEEIEVVLFTRCLLRSEMSESKVRRKRLGKSLGGR